MTAKTNKIESGFAVCGALLIILFVVTVNSITSPFYPWFVYPAFAVLWWPLSVIVPRRFGARIYSVLGSALTAAFLCIVNTISTPHYPWILFTLPVLVFWPIFVSAGKTIGKLPFASFTSFTVALYYIVMNLTLAKGFPWSMFVFFALLWWPLSLLFPRKRHFLGFSIASTVIISILFFALNRLTTPDVIWFVYPIFGLLWWPLSLYFFGYKKARLHINE